MIAFMPTILSKHGEKVIVDDHANITSVAVSHGRPVVWDRKTKKVRALGRFLLNAPTDKVVDHIDGDPLNNRYTNLRLCLPKENARNSRKRLPKTTSSFKGVSKRRRGWSCQIKVDYSYIHLGLWKTERAAAICYNIHAKKFFGEFAHLNSIPNVKPTEVSAIKRQLNNPKKRSGNTKYVGVCYYPDRNNYMSYINVNGKRKVMGRFPTAWEAAKAYNIEAAKIGRKTNKL